jgi:hypothetical protein
MLTHAALWASRERHLHDRLAGRRPGPVPVATRVRSDAGDDSADMVWALVGDLHP